MDKAFISYDDIERILTLVYRACKTGDFVSEISDPETQELIKRCKDVDFNIKTKPEQKSNRDLLFTHGPARIATFLLSYYAEHSLIDAVLTIRGDDWPRGRISHDNTYRLSLHDADSHKRLYKADAERKAGQYDFDALFMQQLTHYPDSDKPENTTLHSYDSFRFGTESRLGYRIPKRSIEIKSALWISRANIHGADYVIKFDYDGPKLLPSYNLFDNRNISGGDLRLTAIGEVFYRKYYEFLSAFKTFENHSWDEFILG